MTVITQSQAKALIKSGNASQVCTTYQPHNDKTYGVINNSATQKTQHYLIGAGDLRDDVPMTIPTFRK